MSARTLNVDAVQSLLQRRAIDSLSFADRPDTPSVYTQFSPRSTRFHDVPELDLPPPIPNCYFSRDSSQSYSDHDSLSEDAQSLFTSQNSPRLARMTRAEVSSSASSRSSNEGTADQGLARTISLSGPKMKIHGPAPWEIDIRPAEEPSRESKDVETRSIFSVRRRNKAKKMFCESASAKSAEENMFLSKRSAREQAIDDHSEKSTHLSVHSQTQLLTCDKETLRQQHCRDYQVSTMRGWGEVPGVPTNNLISLQEAFLRARDGNEATDCVTSQARGSNEGGGIPQPTNLQVHGNRHRTLAQKRSGLLKMFNRDREERNTRLLNVQKDASSVENQTTVAFTMPKSVSNHGVELRQHNKSATSLQKAPSASTVLNTGRSQREARLSISTATLNRSKLENSAPTLPVRPISTLFSERFPEHILTAPRVAPMEGHQYMRTSSSSSALSSPATSPLPTTTPSQPKFMHVLSSYAPLSNQQLHAGQQLKDEVITAKGSWQLQIQDLKRQITELKMDLERIQGVAHLCSRCERDMHLDMGVLNRPRGTSSIGPRTLFGSSEG